MSEDKESWLNFFRGLKERGLRGAWLVVGDQYLGLVEAALEALPEAKIQRRVVRFYRNVLSKVPKSKVKAVANSGRRLCARKECQEGGAKDRASREGTCGHGAE